MADVRNSISARKTTGSGTALTLPGSGTGDTSTALVAGDPVYVLVESNAANNVPSAANGLVPIAYAATGTGTVMVWELTGGWQSGVTTVAPTFTGSAATVMQTSIVVLDGSAWSGVTHPATPSSACTVRGSSSATLTLPSSGTAGKALVFAGEKASTHADLGATYPTSSPAVTLVTKLLTNGASDPSSFIGLITDDGSTSVTLTYQTASANAGGVILALVPAGTSSTAAGTITLAGSVSAAAAATATGSLVLTGTATGPGSAATGALTLSGAVTARAATAAAGTLVLSGSATAGSPTLRRVWLGIPDTTAIRVTTRTSAVSTVRLAVSTSAGMTSPTYSPPTAPDSDGYATNVTVTGLTAGTAYWYQVELNGSLVGSPVKTATLPTAPADFSVAFGSCVAVLGSNPSTLNPSTFASIANRPSVSGATGPDEFWHLGDISYPNNASSPNGDYITDSVPVIQANLEAGLDTNLAALTARTPSGYTWSDNDSGGGNCDAGSGAWPALSNGTAGSVVRQITSYPALPDAGALYHAHMRGRVLIITIDDRTYSSGATVTDNSSKTKLGATQRAWLLNLISGARAAGAAFIMIMADGNWLDTGTTSPSGDAGTSAQNDGWGAYGTERTTIANAIVAAGWQKALLWCNGDTHSIEIDDGANNSHGGFATFNCAPFRNTATADTKTRSNGVYPASNTANSQYYGWVDITDDGTTVTAACSAWDATSSAGVYTSDVQRGTTMTLTATTGTATGALSLSGTAIARAGATAAGTLTLTGAASAHAPGTTTGTLDLTGTATALPAGNTAAGTLTLTGTAVASAAASAVGALSLSGTVVAIASAAGVLILTGNAAAAGPSSAAAGTITLAGMGTALVYAITAGEITMTGLAHATSGGLAAAPPERTYTVPAEHRIYHVTSGDHAYARS